MAKKKNHKELMNQLKENPPSEHITVTVVLDDENETEFNFTRSMEAYDRYLTTLIIDKKLLTAASVFLMDIVIEEEREALAYFLSAYPNEAMKIVSHIADVYSGSIETKLKNA
ncbi:MAG: putative phage tail assembly chaperone [bacterium]